MNYFLHHGQRYVYVLTDSKSFWVSVALAFITLLAVLVALSQEWRKERRKRTEIDLKINLSPPDCQRITLFFPTNKENEFIPIKSVYLRINAINKSAKPAENVEIFLSKLWEINENGNKKLVTKFIPMNLIWSHFNTHTVRIPGDIFRHCDFGYFAKSDKGNLILTLKTIIQPTPVVDEEVPNMFYAGNYEFELLVSGDNITPTRKRWLLWFNGKWDEDESEMLNTNIKIREL